MSEWYVNQKKSCSNIRKLLHEGLDKENPSRKLTAEETKHDAQTEKLLLDGTVKEQKIDTN